METFCPSCDIPTKKCVVWPFFMDYCEQCFTVLVYSSDITINCNEKCCLDVLKEQFVEDNVQVCLPRLNAATALNHSTYFSIYGVQIFCQKVNKESQNRENWFLANVQNVDDSYLCTISKGTTQGTTQGVSQSVVYALNEEIANNVYDKDVYKTILIKSIIYKNRFERALDI